MNNNNPKVSNDRSDYQHDPFVVDWSCVNPQKKA